MTIVYGIPNCDTVKKARAWMAAQGVAHSFHDFKKQGVCADKLLEWAHAAGWDTLLNRRGTSWRKLDVAAQKAAETVAGRIALITANPSLIRRPVIEWDCGGLRGMVTVGFKDPPNLQFSANSV